MTFEFTETLNENFPLRATDRLISINFETDGISKIVPWSAKS